MWDTFHGKTRKVLPDWWWNPDLKRTSCFKSLPFLCLLLPMWVLALGDCDCFQNRKKPRTVQAIIAERMTMNTVLGEHGRRKRLLGYWRRVTHTPNDRFVIPCSAQLTTNTLLSPYLETESVSLRKHHREMHRKLKELVIRGQGLNEVG